MKATYASLGARNAHNAIAADDGTGRGVTLASGFRKARLNENLRLMSGVVETRYRSFVKAVSWRATGTLDTIVVSFLVTGRLKFALSIGLVELFTKLGLYYLHERLWGKIRFGRVKAREDYQI